MVKTADFTSRPCAGQMAISIKLGENALSPLCEKIACVRGSDVFAARRQRAGAKRNSGSLSQRSTAPPAPSSSM